MELHKIYAKVYELPVLLRVGLDTYFYLVSCMLLLINLKTGGLIKGAVSGRKFYR